MGDANHAYVKLSRQARFRSVSERGGHSSLEHRRGWKRHAPPYNLTGICLDSGRKCGAGRDGRQSSNSGRNPGIFRYHVEAIVPCVLCIATITCLEKSQKELRRPERD